MSQIETTEVAKCQEEEECEVKPLPLIEDETSMISSKLEHTRGDIQQFEDMFEQWKQIENTTDKQEKDLMQNMKKLEKENAEHVLRIQDLEMTNGLLQKALDSIHNDLNLLDMVTKENKEFKDKRKAEAEEWLSKENLMKVEITMLNNTHEKEIKRYKKEMEQMLTDHKNKMRDIENEHSKKIQCMETTIDRMTKRYETDLSLQSAEYENKLAKLHSQKAAAAANQQQQSLSHQEIYRNKLQHMKNEHEAKTNELKSQIRSLQEQLNAQRNVDFHAEPIGMHNRMSVSNVGQSGNKRMRRY